MRDVTSAALLEGDPVELILTAARGERWIDLFSVAVSVYASGYGDMFDDPERFPEFDQALGTLEPELAARIRICIKDAAATMEHVLPDPRGKDGDQILYLSRLWAAMVALNPGVELSEADFERIGECLEDATDDDQVVVIPKLVHPEDFISTSRGTIWDITGRMFFNVLDEDDDDPLEGVRRSNPDPGALPVPDGYGVVVGLKLSLFRAEAPEIVSIAETHESHPRNVEHFRSLVEEAVPAIGYIDFPMAAGSASVEIARSILLAKALDFIKAHASAEGSEVAILAEDHVLRIAVEGEDGDSVADCGLDVSSGLWRATDAADVLKLRLPSIRIAATAADFWQAASRGATFN